MHGDVVSEALLEDAFFLEELFNEVPQNLPQEAYIDDFEEAVSDRARNTINVLRRAGNGEDRVLAPIRHIEVRGHWQRAAYKGAAYRLGSRISWFLSMLTPEPLCLDNAFPLVPPDTGMEFLPFLYWVDLVHLAIPVVPPITTSAPRSLPCATAALKTGGLDATTTTRFALGGVGAAAELMGQLKAQGRAFVVGAELGRVVGAAIDDARDGMDLCDGQVVVDLVGYSRGGPIVSTAFNLMTTPNRRFNTRMSGIYLGAVDHLPFDHWRPWIRPGVLIQDGAVARRGSERISNFWADIPGNLPFVLPAPEIDVLVAVMRPDEALLIDALLTEDDRLSEVVVGMPRGHARSSLQFLGPIGSFNGPLFLNHVQIHRPNPAGVGAFLAAANFDTPAVDLSGAPLPAAFTFSRAGLMGELFVDARAAIVDGLGWHADPVPGLDDELPFLPFECPDGTGTGEPDADRFAEALRQSGLTGASQRELVRDRGFLLSRSIVRLSDVVVELRDDESLKGLIGDEVLRGDLGGPVIARIVEDASAERFPPAGVWQRTSGTVTIEGANEEPLETPLLRELLPHTDLSLFDGLDEDDREEFDAALAEVVAARDDLLRELEAQFNAKLEEPAELRHDDRMHYLSSLAAGDTKPANAFAAFRATATLAQELAPASMVHQDFLVRVDARFMSHAGQLSIELQGDGLAASIYAAATGGPLGVRRTVTLRGSRTDTASAALLADTVEITGRDVDVFSVSITPVEPVYNPDTNRFYELVVLDRGVDWAFAEAEANEMRFESRAGRLAVIEGEQDIEFLVDALKLDTLAWVAGRGLPDDEGGFTQHGASFPSDLWHPESTFPRDEENLREHFVYLSPGEETTVRHSAPAVRNAGRAYGFIVEYGPRRGVVLPPQGHPQQRGPPVENPGLFRRPPTTGR